LPVVWLDEIKPTPPEPTVRIDWRARTIDIWGGASCHTKGAPYWIPFSEVGTTEEIADWLVHIGEKAWFFSLDPLRRALLKVHRALGRPA
jgi:hypothetical protein